MDSDVNGQDRQPALAGRVWASLRREYRAQWAPWLRVHWARWWRLNRNDVALRRGARAAVVIPLAFLLARLVIGNPQALIFIVFGCFALLVMADFGGPRPPRLLAYLVTVVAGAILVALGTLVSATPAGGAAAMLVVGFGLAFAAVFGGYVAVAQTGLLLAFVISISLPAPPSAIPGRVGGWLLAGILSTIAAAILWPRPERDDLPTRAAEAVLAVAHSVSAGSPISVRDAREAVRAAREEYSATARRPAGLSRRNRAYFEMFSELDQVIDLVQAPFHAPEAKVRPSTDEGQRLAASVLDALRASAAVLTGGDPPDLRAVDRARSEHRAALDRWVIRQLQGGRPVVEVLDGHDHDLNLRVVSYLAIGLGGNALIAAGRGLDTAISLPAAIPRRAGPAGVGLRLLRTIRAHLEPRSPVLHNSLRVAIGLAVSVFLARTLGFSHAFWVVLGTLQVLRTSALGTGRTTLQALAGNVLGVVVGGLFAVLAGNNALVMWFALPFTVFFASYAATTVGFMLSQAAFTLNLIIVFNLISPAGWQVGLIRIEDVAVGTAVSVAAGILLWPRGARQDLARSVSSFYRSTAAYLGGAFDRVLGFEVGNDVEALRRRAVRARDRAAESLQVLLAEHGAEHLEPQAAAALVTAGNQVMLAADALTLVATELGYRAGGSAGGVAPIRNRVRTLLGRLTNLAARLEDDHPLATGPAEPVSAQALRAAALSWLDRWDRDSTTGQSALAVMMALEWAQNVARLETNVEQPLSAAVAASRIPWWR